MTRQILGRYRISNGTNENKRTNARTCSFSSSFVPLTKMSLAVIMVLTRISRNKIRRALCPGRVGSCYDPLSHVPGLWWIVLVKNLLIWAFLGTSSHESVLPAGYLPATCWIIVVVAGQKSNENTRVKRRSALHGRIWGPSWAVSGGFWWIFRGQL